MSTYQQLFLTLDQYCYFLGGGGGGGRGIISYFSPSETRWPMKQEALLIWIPSHYV